MNKILEVLGGLAKLALTVVGIIALIDVASWLISAGIESWRTKDEAYRRDCIVIPIAGAILGIGCMIIGIGWLLFPAFR